MAVPTRQRTHLLAGPSLSGGSCGSISGDRGRVGRAGHQRGDRAVTARWEDRGRGCHRLQESRARRRTPSSGPRGRRPIPSLRASVRTNTSWGQGARVAPGLNRLRQNERQGGGGRVTSRIARFRRADLRGQFRKTRLCSCLDSPFALVGILDRFALRRPVLASWRCLPDVEPVGRSSRAGGLCHVPDRQAGLPRAEVLRQPQFAQRLSSPPASPRSPLRPAAPRTIPQASAPASTRTATAPSWRSSSTSAAARSRARRCPFPRGVDWTTERLWRKL